MRFLTGSFIGFASERPSGRGSTSCDWHRGRPPDHRRRERHADPRVETLHRGSQAGVRLPLHLSFEFDALYRDVGFTGYTEGCCGSSITRERDTSWEFPMILKYHFPGVATAASVRGDRLRAAYCVRHATFLRGLIERRQPALIRTSFRQINVSYPVTQGLVVSGGVEFGARHLLISPELRYVHWNAPFLNEFGGDGSSRYTSPQNELFVLVGIAWRLKIGGQSCYSE